MSQATSTKHASEPNLMPPIVYTSHRMFDPERKEITTGVRTQQPYGSINESGTFRDIRLYHESTELTCPICKQRVMTVVTYKTSSRTWAYSCCMDSCLPFCMDSMKAALHNCPSCKAYLGTHEP